MRGDRRVIWSRSTFYLISFLIYFTSTESITPPQLNFNSSNSASNIFESRLNSIKEMAQNILSNFTKSNIKIDDKHNHHPHHHHQHHQHHQHSKDYDNTENYYDDNDNDNDNKNENDFEENTDEASKLVNLIKQKREIEKEFIPLTLTNSEESSRQSQRRIFMKGGSRPVFDLSTIGQGMSEQQKAKYREKFAQNTENILSISKKLGTKFSAMRASCENTISSGGRLSSVQIDWWSNVTIYLESDKGACQFMGIKPVTSEEKLHVWLKKMSEDKKWTIKRKWKQLYDHLKRQSAGAAGLAGPGKASNAIQMFELTEMGGTVQREVLNAQLEKILNEISPAIYSHGFTILSDYENRNRAPKPKSPSLPMELDPLPGGQFTIPPIFHAIAEQQQNMHKAMKDWVKPKFTEFPEDEGTLCPKIMGDASIMTLFKGHYPDGIMKENKLADNQLCNLCRGTITIIQKESVRGPGDDWNTQTDALNRAMTVVCDRIVELNPSPHWRSDCKNLVEYWGPQILCNLENAEKEFADIPVKNANIKEGSKEPSFDIEGIFTPLSKSLCERLKLKFSIETTNGLEADVQGLCKEESKLEI